MFRPIFCVRNLQGKCGNGECREICGGSRARVFALTGELFGQDPSCIYQPRRGQSANTKRVAQTEAEAKIISQ